MKKLLIITGIIIIIIAFINMPQKGTFEELVLDKYAENEFDTMYIDNFAKGSRVTSDIDKIESLISYLENFELIEYSGSVPRDTDTFRVVCFRNKKNYETLHIGIENPKYLYINIKTLHIENDEKNKITSTTYKRDSKTYKILNANIDIKYIDDLYKHSEVR